MERQAALGLAAGAKPAAAFALMASAAPALKEIRTMSGPLKAAELPPLPGAKHAIGGGTVQVICIVTLTLLHLLSTR